MAIQPTLTETRLLADARRRLRRVFADARGRLEAVSESGDDFDILAEMQRIVHKIVGYLYYCRHYQELDPQAPLANSVTKIIRLARQAQEKGASDSSLWDQTLASIQNHLAQKRTGGAIEETLWTKRDELRRRRWRQNMTRVRTMFTITEHRYEWHEIPQIQSVPAEEKYLFLAQIDSTVGLTDRKLVTVAAAALCDLSKQIIKQAEGLCLLRYQWQQSQQRFDMNCKVIADLHKIKVTEYADKN